VLALVQVSRRSPLVVPCAGPKKVLLEDLRINFEVLKAVLGVFPDSIPSHPLLALSFRDLLTITGVGLPQEDTGESEGV
jgi:hypothetical protein